MGKNGGDWGAKVGSEWIGVIGDLYDNVMNIPSFLVCKICVANYR